MQKRLGIAAMGVALMATASAGYGAVIIDSFTTSGGTVNYPLTDTISTVSQPVFDETPEVFGDVRILSIGALPPTPLPPDMSAFDDDAATLNLDTSAGELTASATAEVGAGLLLGYTAPTASPANIDVTGEDRVLIEYSATSDVTTDITFGNYETGSGLLSNGSRTAPFVLPAGTGTFEVLFSDFTEGVRQPYGTEIITLPAADFASLDTITFDFTATTSGSSFTLTSLTIVPEPASLGATATLGLLLLGRRRD